MPFWPLRLVMAQNPFCSGSIPVMSPSVLRQEAFGPGAGRGYIVSCCENMLRNDAAAMGCSPQPMTFLAPAVAP
jgi:hypothetical protein